MEATVSTEVLTAECGCEFDIKWRKQTHELAYKAAGQVCKLSRDKARKELPEELPTEVPEELPEEVTVLA